MNQSNVSGSLRILIVDDHQAFRTDIRKMLEESGHFADEASSVVQAVPMVESGHYQMVLLDYRMPGHDGLWLLRNTRVPRTTKVLFMTAHGHNELLMEAFRVGVKGYLIKPFEKEDLLNHIAFHAAR